MHNLALSYEAIGDLAAAKDTMQRVLALRLEMFGPQVGPGRRASWRRAFWLIGSLAGVRWHYSWRCLGRRWGPGAGPLGAGRIGLLAYRLALRPEMRGPRVGRHEGGAVWCSGWVHGAGPVGRASCSSGT